jgi:hypothetical protein
MTRGICIESVTELVDLEVKYANRTSKGGIRNHAVEYVHIVSYIVGVGINQLVDVEPDVEPALRHISIVPSFVR